MLIVEDNSKDRVLGHTHTTTASSITPDNSADNVWIAPDIGTAGTALHKHQHYPRCRHVLETCGGCGVRYCTKCGADSEWNPNNPATWRVIS